MRVSAPLFLVMLAAAGCAPRSAGPVGPRPRASIIDTVSIRAHTWFLTQDRLAGRGTGDARTLIAADYIVAQCRALGLEPVGPTYHEPVRLVDARLDATSHLVVLSDQDTVTFVHGRDFIVVGGSMESLARQPPTDAHWLDAETAARATVSGLRGTIVVTDGVLPPDAGVQLAAAGVRAVVGLVGTDDALQRYAASFGSPLRFATPTASSFFTPVPTVIAGRALTRSLGPLADGASRRILLSLEPHPGPVEAVNVGCRLNGDEAGWRDTAIVFTAHYDHLGVGPAVSGDTVYNGFSDNAAGVSMLLAIAQAFRGGAMPRPRHSILFLFFTGEERGLLGSDWWIANPTWPLERIRAVINLDAGAPPGPVWSWHIAGGSDSWLGSIVRDVAASRGWAAVLQNARANSDYFPFHRVGIPAVFPIPAPAPYEGLTADSSRALRERWDRYHQPGDEWFADFPFVGLQRYAEFAMWIGLAVDGRNGPGGAPLRR